MRSAATSAGPRASPRRAAPTPARTPARGQSRFAQQAATQEGGAAHDRLAAAAAAAGTDPTAGSDNIRVVVRVRPRNERELTLGGGMCVQPQGSTAVRVASHHEPHAFSFDYVAGDDTDQASIFEGRLWPWAWAAARCLIMAITGKGAPVLLLAACM